MEHIETGLTQFGKDFKMIVSCGEKVISITKRQFTFLKSFLANGDVDDAAAAAGVARSSIIRWFRDPKFRQFLQERLQYAADRNGCTFDWAVSELKSVWAGKKEKSHTQLDAMKEINKMLGHVKEYQGGVHAREFINAEYVVIQKNGPVDSESQPPQISGASRSIEGQVYLPDVREAMGQVNPGGMEGGQGDQPAPFDGMVPEQPAQTGQGYDLVQDASNLGAMQNGI